MINITDIVALAKAGYKPSEVKELLSLASTQEDKPNEGEQKGQDQEGSNESKGSDQPEDKDQKSTVTPSESEAILSYKKKVEELEEKIQKLQQDNVHQNNEDDNTPSDEETVNEITRMFM